MIWEVTAFKFLNYKRRKTERKLGAEEHLKKKKANFLCEGQSKETKWRIKKKSSGRKQRLRETEQRNKEKED